MKYKIIDLDTWERGKLFRFFIDNLRNVMSMTVDIDVTPLKEYIKAQGLKFYPTMMWVVSKIINSHNEFKYGWNSDGNLIRWEYVSPYYADFHNEDESCVKLVTEFSDDLKEFHSHYLADKERYQQLRAFDLKDIPKNTFDVSCLPWVKYKCFDIHVFDSGTYLAPVVTWGKYETENNRLIMPLSMNIHHAVADGFHLCRFFMLKYITKNDERVVYSKGLKSYIVADILDEDIVCPYGNDENEYKFVLADNFTCISYGEILGTVSPEIIEKMPKSN